MNEKKENRVGRGASIRIDNVKQNISDQNTPRVYEEIEQRVDNHVRNRMQTRYDQEGVQCKR